MFGQLLSAAVIEAKTIDERAITRQTKNAWPRIAGLWLSRNGAHFDETKTQSAQSLCCGSVLIKARREPNWITKLDAKTVQLAKGLTLKSPGDQVAHGLVAERYGKRTQSKLMRCLCRQAKQDGAND